MSVEGSGKEDKSGGLMPAWSKHESAPLAYGTEHLIAIAHYFNNNLDANVIAKGTKLELPSGGAFEIRADVYCAPNALIEQGELLGTGTFGEVYSGINLTGSNDAGKTDKYVLKKLKQLEKAEKLTGEVSRFNVLYKDILPQALLSIYKESQVIIMPLIPGASAIDVLMPDQAAKSKEDRKQGKSSEVQSKIGPEVHTEENDKSPMVLNDGSINDKGSMILNGESTSDEGFTSSGLGGDVNLRLKYLLGLLKDRSDDNHPEPSGATVTLFEHESVLTANDPEFKFGQNFNEKMDLCLKISANMCSSMHDAHERGLLLRDFKPDNFNVNPEDEYKAQQYDMGSSIKLEDKNIIEVKDDFAHGSMHYLTPFNKNTCRYLDKHSEAKAVAVEIIALLNANPDLECPPDIYLEIKNKAENILPQYVYSKRTDEYALGVSLEDILMATLLSLGVCNEGLTQNYYSHLSNKKTNAFEILEVDKQLGLSNNEFPSSYSDIAGASEEQKELINAILSIISRLKGPNAERLTSKEAMHEFNCLKSKLSETKKAFTI